MTRYVERIGYPLLFLFTLLLTACSSGDSSGFQPSLAVSVRLEAGTDINLFDDDLPRPVLLRLYQLADQGRFQKADFISLYESDKSVLADSLIDSSVLEPVLPGEQREFTLDLQPQARFIGVLAEFANYEIATGKAVVVLVEEPQENPIIIRISQSKVEISQPVDTSWW